MQPKDVRPCARFLASFPEERRRYGDLLEKVPTAWLNLLRQRCLNSAVHRSVYDLAPRISGLCASVFVSDELLADLKRPPLAWIGPELVRRTLSADPGILSAKQIREANSGSGLNLVVWTGVETENTENRAALVMELMHSFTHTHLGFRMKEVLVQPNGLQRTAYTLNLGALFWDADPGCYRSNSAVPSEDAELREPYLLGCDREATMQRLGVWFSMFFPYTPPKIYFRPAEQRLLLAALRGLTDQEAADELSISLSGVKKTWRLIYDRAGEIFVAGDRDSDEFNAKRGRQKKHRLLAYLRDHMQELRPVLPPRRTRRSV